MKQFLIHMFLVFLVLPFMVNAQKKVQLTIVDASDKTPLIGAHVCLVFETEESFYYATDIKGQVSIPFSDEMKCTVSYTGFVTMELEISGKENQHVKLKPDLLMLDQVVKTATVEAQKVDESIYKIGVINSVTLEKQGVQNVTDALRFQPNINLRQDGVLGSQIIMQGLEGQHVKILVDGIPIIGRQDGNIDLSQIDMSQVDHVEIIEGPMSVVYGSNALAGTINIIMKESKYYSLDGSASVYAESVGQYNGNVSVSGNAGKHKYGVSGGYRFFDGHDFDKSTRAMNWNPKSQLNTDVYYGFKTKIWDTKIGTRLGQENLTYKGNYVSGASAFDTEFITKRVTYYGQSTGQFQNKSALKAMISLSTYNRTSERFFVNVANGTSVPQEASSNQFDTWNARLSYANSLTDQLKWQIGYELTDESGEGERVSTNDGLTENAIWSDLQIVISDHLTLQPGIRYLHHNVYNPPLIYSAHVKWHSDSKWEGRLSFARGFRAPSMKELYMDFVDTNHQIFGNPDLVSETSYNVSGSISKLLKLTENAVIKAEISGFYNHLFDVISLVQDTGGGQAFYYQNISEKKTHGGTLTLNYNQDNRLKANIGFTLTGIGYNLNEIAPVDFRYSKDLVAMVSYFLPKWDLSSQLDCKYTGERTRLSGSESEVVVGTVGAYTMLNYSLTKSFKNKRFVLTAGIKNILDVTNVSNTTQGGAHSGGTSGAMIAWGRTFYGSIKFNLKKI